MTRVNAEPTSGDRRAERGHLMVGLMALIAIMLIFSTMAFQAWEDVLRRDNEAEMIFRAQEIVRAIQRYRADHGGVAPLEFENLIEPGPKGQYYLRRLYDDPLVTDGAWGLLHIGPGGEIIDPAALPEQAAGLDGGLGGRSGGLSSAFDNKKQGGPNNRGAAGQGPQGAGRRRPGQLGGLQSQQSGAGGNTGLPIAGVRTLSTEQPFRHYKGFSDYSQWLFTYLDLEVQQVPGQGGPGGRRGGRQGGAQPGTPQPGISQPPVPRLNPKTR